MDSDKLEAKVDVISTVLIVGLGYILVTNIKELINIHLINKKSKGEA